MHVENIIIYFILSLCLFIFGYKIGLFKLDKKSEQMLEDYINKNKYLLQKEKELAIIEKKKDLLELERNFEKKIIKSKKQLSIEKHEFDNYVSKINKEIEQKLFDLSALDEDEAKDIVFSTMKSQITSDINRFTHLELIKSKNIIKKNIKSFLLSLMERYAGNVTAEKNSTSLKLADNNIKGKIIGRDGRNIRSFEQVTGVELIIDDTPNRVFLSSFDPIKRQLAKNLLIDLVENNKINPSHIEKEYKNKVLEFERNILDKGLQVLIDLKISPFDEEIIKLIGKMEYRTSYGQNLLTHSIEVASFCAIIASELGEDVDMAKKAGLLHDIGKVIECNTGNDHIELGVILAKKFNLSDVIVNAIESHHNDSKKEYVISEIVSISDTLSAARLGARKELYEIYITKLKNLEKISKEFDGVQDCHVIQSGREIRVIVDSNKVKDEDLNILSYKIKKKIESEINYCGHIKVVAIRETRGVAITK